MSEITPPETGSYLTFSEYVLTTTQQSDMIEPPETGSYLLLHIILRTKEEGSFVLSGLNEKVAGVFTPKDPNEIFNYI